MTAPAAGPDTPPAAPPVPAPPIPAPPAAAAPPERGSGFVTHVTKFLTFTAALASLSKLVATAYDFRFGEIYHRLITEYDETIGGVAALAEPLVRLCAAHLRDWLDLGIEPAPYWRHVFVLLMLYFSGDAYLDWQRGGVRRAWRVSAVVTTLAGLVLAFVAAIAAGMMGDAPAARVMAVPVLCVTLYELQRALVRAVIDPIDGARLRPPFDALRGRRVQTFEHLARRFVSTSFSLGCLAIAVVAILDPPGRTEAVITGFLLYVALLAVRNVAQGAYMTLAYRDPARSRRAQFRAYRTVSLGKRILWIMGSVLVAALLAVGGKLP